ncbi:MAG: hypothetical protein JWN44_1949 [Myxococcales bacterium]|nr:hypothetical protein [Myxococcales bacterium]
MRPLLGCALVLAGALLGGCAPEEVERFQLRITALSDEGQPLEKLPVRIDDEVIGRTDGAGRLDVALPGPEGRRVNVAVDPPAGFRGGTQSRSVLLDRLVRRADGTRAPLEVETHFSPTARSYVLLVDVGIPALPVEIFGVKKATTNSEGVAMLLVPGVPGDDLQVRVTRGQRPDLSPPFLGETFTLPDHASVCILDGRFNVAHKAVARAHRPSRL